MTERKTLVDQSETPEDVATLYSWANLHGAKYRDFSASRAVSREKARLRVQESVEEGQSRARTEVETPPMVEGKPRTQAPQATPMRSTSQEQGQPPIPPQVAPKVSQQAVHSSHFDRFAGPPPTNSAAYYAEQALAPRQTQAPEETQPHKKIFQEPAAPAREERGLRNPWAREDAPEAVRPAWLGSDLLDMSPPPVAKASEEALVSSRDRLTSRWFALKSVFEGGPAPEEEVAVPVASRAPVIAVFSLAGGVGKTSLVATLGRALSARGERVLLVDTAAYGLLPFFFGARDQRPGVLRTFTPPGASGDAPLQMVTFDADSLGPEPDSPSAPDKLVREIARQASGVSRVIVDLGTASGSTVRRIMRMSPTILVPVVPDMNSVVSVSSIDAFFRHNGLPDGSQANLFYVLNQFDSSLPLHLDVREVLREMLGKRLLPFSLHRSSSISEALAEGMTVMDYAPNSTAAEDFGYLAGWIKSLAAPATSGYRGVRWSER